MVKIFIGNLQEGARSTELRQMFERYGKVAECDVLTGFGFVVSISCTYSKFEISCKKMSSPPANKFTTNILQHMDHDDDANAAVKGLDGAFFGGATIKVEVCVKWPILPMK